MSKKRKTEARGVRHESGLSAQRRPTVRLRSITLAVLATIAAGALAWYPLRYRLPGLLGATTIPAPNESPAVSSVARVDFVGAQKCAGCHAAEFAKWERSTHGRAGGPPSPDVVIAAFNGRPIRFRDAVVTPRLHTGAYEFVVARDDDTAEVVRVDGVIGRGHMEGGGTQGFVTKRPDGTVRFLPFDWSRHGSTWFCNTNSRTQRGWVPITESMRLAECGDWPPTRVLGDEPRWANCQGCHGSQISVDDSAGTRTTRLTSLAINCESCHGPARRHVELAESGRLAQSADIGLISLRTLGKDASLNVCFQCHSVKDQLRPGYLPGDSLELFYSLRLPAIGDRPLHPDGRVRTFAYQEGHRFSDCYVNGGLTCTSCHDPHSQGYRTIDENALDGRTHDAQCTSCHLSKAVNSTAHTRHASGSAGSRCTACHMPYLQQPETIDPRTGRGGVRYARSDHSIPIPRPMSDARMGIRTACASCHTNRTTQQLADQVSAWWGSLKPLPSPIRVQFRVEAAERGLEASLAPEVDGTKETASVVRAMQLAPLDAGYRHAAATFAGVARFLERSGRPDSVALDPDERRWLRDLSQSADLDTRALALATLHFLNGGQPDVRRELAAAAVREGKRDFALRSRWSMILGDRADRATESGDFSSAITGYRRALDVTPGDARLLLSLGNAQRAKGDARGAVQSYELALTLNPRSSLVWVNYGIALGALGDSVRGADAFRRATEVDPNEPLGWFNLGNVTLLRGDLGGAAGQFGRATALDGSLVEAHFQIARIRLLQRDNRSALAALRRGLALDSTNTAARDLARSLSGQLSIPQPPDA